jgi:DNA-binding MarR family transcriptional regulator
MLRTAFADNPGGARMKDPLLRLSGYVLRRASVAALAELNEGLAPLGLRHAAAAMLMLIESRPGITQSEAARVLDIQRANMVPFIARLEKRGVIRRRQVDGRSQALDLTGRGRMLLARARRVVEAHEAALLARVPEPLRPMVLPVLTALWKREPH